MMDGRVKTLHPKVHGGLLAIRGNKEHVAAMEEHRINPIDLLVVNLYPFEATVAKGASFDDCVENIDIGGPAMIRAAAKNHADVAVIVDPADYEKVLGEMAKHSGMVSLELRQKLAAKAYARTAAYDAAISNWFADALHDDAPDYRAFGGKLIEALRYGENPHQSAAFYRSPGERFGVATARQLQGKQLSYNNINDTDAAYECIGEFDPKRTAACVIVKHANPCGVAEADTLLEAYRKALACDTTSAFGGIVALNRKLDAEAAKAITEIFTEVIIAPEATDEAIKIVAAKKNLRLLIAGGLPDPRAKGLTVKTVAGGLLVQSRDNAVVDEMQLKTVTKRAPSAADEARQHPLLAYYVNNINQSSFFQDGQGLGSAMSEAEVAQMRATYCGLMSEVDDQLGRVFDYLKQTGQWDDTLIVLTCDHGEQLGDHHLLGKIGYGDESYRIPMIVRDPRPEANGTRGSVVERFTDQLCELIGLSPMGTASVPQPDKRKEKVAYRCGEVIMDAVRNDRRTAR